jgi:predicted nucleotidyltransferase
MSWDDYIQSIEEAKKYHKKRARKSGPGIERSLKWFLDKGPQKKGGYPKNRRPNFRRKKFNDISAPPGAPGGLEEVERESFTLHDELQPDMWEGDKLNQEVEARLVEIARDFIDTIEESKDIGAPITIEDIRLTGSLANYNWSRYSDVDLHIVVDFSKINEDTGLVKAFFDEVRMRWNDKHDIKIHGFEVEIYVENVNEEHKSSGIYSLGADLWSAGDDAGEHWTDWLVKPTPGDAQIDFDTAEKKAKDYAERTESIEKNMIGKRKDYEQAIRTVDRVKQKIRDMRQAGLESEEAEFSAENIAFKMLRRDGVLERLSAAKRTAYDQLMTMKEE